MCTREEDGAPGTREMRRFRKGAGEYVEPGGALTQMDGIVHDTVEAFVIGSPGGAFGTRCDPGGTAASPVGEAAGAHSFRSQSRTTR